MKASIKFREEQKPLIKAKVPLNGLSLPFQSGVVAGESKELSFNLSTFFNAGPIFKVAYRPNDTQNPVSFICKSGVGNFGSPISSPFTMTTELNLAGNQNSAFFVHFKPKFGDFTIKSSLFCKKIDPKLNDSVSTDGVTDMGTRYFEESELSPKSGKINVLPVLPVFPIQSAATASAAVTSVMESVLSGAKVKATTALRLMNRVVVNSHWGLRFPPALVADEVEDTVIVPKNERTNGISLRRFPLLFMEKITIKHVSKEKVARHSKVGLNSNSEVAEACLNIKKQVEIIQAENSLLRRALEDVRLEFANGKFILAAGDGGGTVETGRDGGGYQRLLGSE